VAGFKNFLGKVDRATLLADYHSEFATLHPEVEEVSGDLQGTESGKQAQRACELDQLVV
jgi:hypothetical protein